ncbi:hypothetical protein BGZ63DRAFT_409615 [Mariannaea sp. PMI_226]|nr:hypothetical protein BGZ63DRAFT_409615 [Mariannaea sp. PMI_226]
MTSRYSITDTAQFAQSKGLPINPHDKSQIKLFASLCEISKKDIENRVQKQAIIQKWQLKQYLEYLNGLDPETVTYVFAILDAPEMWRQYIMKLEEDERRLEFERLLMALTIIQNDQARFRPVGNVPIANAYIPEAYDTLTQKWIALTRSCYICKSVLKGGVDVVETIPNSLVLHLSCIERLQK